MFTDFKTVYFTVLRRNRVGYHVTDSLTQYNVCAVPWECSVQWGDIMMHVGDILSTVGDIMSTMEGVQYRGGYHPL